MARLAKISVRNETPKILKSSALKYCDSGPPGQIHHIAVKNLPFGNPPRQIKLHSEVNEDIGPSAPGKRGRQRKHNPDQRQPRPI